MEKMYADCALRAKYDKNLYSWGGRFWGWHINFCPGWKKYFNSLSVEEQIILRVKYQFIKYQK